MFFRKIFGKKTDKKSQEKGEKKDKNTKKINSPASVTPAKPIEPERKTPHTTPLMNPLPSQPLSAPAASMPAGAPSGRVMTERKSVGMQPAVTYRNHETFLLMNPVSQIPKERLIVLDHYAFDVHELKSYAEANLDTFYKNPHITSRRANNEFSSDAKKLLRQHPVVGKFAAELDEKLAKQKTSIRPETIDAVIRLVKRYNLEGDSKSAEANTEFLRYKETLTVDQQMQLDNFVIEVPILSGGVQRVRFGDNFVDGQCIIAAQVYLWQFVVSLRESAIKQMPEIVQEYALQRGLLISAEPLPEERADQDELMLDEFESSLLNLSNFPRNLGLQLVIEMESQNQNSAGGQPVFRFFVPVLRREPAHAEPIQDREKRFG